MIRRNLNYGINKSDHKLWFTGLSGSGKSTVAVEVEKILNEKKFIKKEVLAYGELNLGFISIFKNRNRIFEIALA